MRRLPVALVALVVLACGVASADTDPERAKALDASAHQHYDLREFAAAIADYKQAFQALPDPLFLFDIAQAYRQLGDCDNARSFYRAYLRDPNADNRAKVEQFITDMNACAHDVQPAPRPAAPVATAAPTPGRGLLYGAIATGATGVIATAVGAYFSFDAHDHAHQLEVHCAQGCDGRDVEAIDRAGHDAQRNAIISYSVGGAAIAAGIVMAVFALRDSEPETPARAALVPVPGGAMFATGGTF